IELCKTAVLIGKRQFHAQTIAPELELRLEDLYPRLRWHHNFFVLQLVGQFQRRQAWRAEEGSEKFVALLFRSFDGSFLAEGLDPIACHSFHQRRCPLPREQQIRGDEDRRGHIHSLLDRKSV